MLKLCTKIVDILLIIHNKLKNIIKLQMCAKCGKKVIFSKYSNITYNNLYIGNNVYFGSNTTIL